MVAGTMHHGNERASVQKREGKMLDLMPTIATMGREGVVDGEEEGSYAFGSMAAKVLWWFSDEGEESTV